MWTDYKLKIRNFFKRHRKKIIIFLIAWVIVITINYMLANMQPSQTYSTAYQPHKSVMTETVEVPKKLQDPIEELVDEYFGYCNNKEYEKAYNMLTEECKAVICPTLQDFQNYVGNTFPNKKAYSLQNYSNVGNIYLYRLRIFDDILATGLTGQDELRYVDDKITIYNENGTLKMAIRSFIQKEDIIVAYENQDLKITIESKITMYDQEIYAVKVTNRGDKTVVLADNSRSEEIVIDTGAEIISRSSSFIPVRVEAGMTITYQLSFAKFFDDPGSSYKMTFNEIRLIDEDAGILETIEPEEVYGVEIPF